MLIPAGMKEFSTRLLRSAVLAVVVWGGGLSAHAEDTAFASSNGPAWLSHGNAPVSASPGNYQRATFRSMGALLLLIGALAGVNYVLRRRGFAGQPVSGSDLRVKARLKLGVRQEVVVVEWEGDQLVLGVGPSFIQPLYTRRGAGATPVEKEELIVGGTGHAS